MKNIKFWLLAILFLPISSLSSSAQTDAQNPPVYDGPQEEPDKDQAWDKATTAIQALKEGVLLVRLTSERRKLEELDRRISNDRLDSKSRTRLKEARKEIIEERDRVNQEFVTAFLSKYNFSEVFFFYDTASIALKQGLQTGVFIDKNLKADAALNLDGRPFLVLRQGALKGNTTGLEALVVMDEQFQDLNKPFPYFVKMRGLGHLLAKIFNPGKESRKSGLKLAEELNTKLWAFYERI